MKKIYNSPLTNVVDIELQKMIAASDTVNVSANNFDPTHGQKLSRRSNFWNYDDEEEY